MARTIYTGKVTAFKPTRADVENLRVGDVAPFALGEAPVTRIYGRGKTNKGKAFVLYYVQWSENSEMSGSMTEGEIVRTVATSRAHRSAELDAFDDAPTRGPRQMRRSHWEAMDRKKNPRPRAPWTIVAEMKAGEPGTEYGIDAVTPVTWIVSRHTIRRREYGYGLPDDLTNSPAFLDWIGGAKSKRVIDSLSRVRSMFRRMLPPEHKHYRANPRLRKNPAPRKANAAPELDQAAKLFRQFTGHNPSRARRVQVPQSRAALAVGPLLAVAYETVRDGKREKYMHEFRRGARPTLAASHDGRILYVLGGAFRFTERGIVDKT